MKRKKTDQVQEPQAIYSKSNEPLSFEKVWLMFQETDKKFKESERMLTEKFQETDKKFQETDKQFKESERLLTEKFQETDKRIKELNNLFTSQWGRLIESLVEGDLVNLLQKVGIPVNRTIERANGICDGENFEFDILALNGEVMVVVEVKTTLRPKNVKEFKAKMKKFRKYMPEYSGKKIIGAMAFLKPHAAADTMAMKEGFFIIRATGNSASIKNEEGFVPVYF